MLFRTLIQFSFLCPGIDGWGKVLAHWESRGEGDEPTISDSSGSDIQSYSDNEGDFNSHAESAAVASSQHVAISAMSSDEDFADTAAGVGEGGVEVKRPSCRRRGRRKARVTEPCPDVPIEDFNSPSSDSADGALHLNLSKPSKKPARSFPPLGGTPPDHMTISTPPSSPPELENSPDHMTISTPPSSPPELGYSPDDMTIFTPPSSPEQASVGSDAGRFKTSEWVRQVRDRGQVNGKGGK